MEWRILEMAGAAVGFWRPVMVAMSALSAVSTQEKRGRGLS